MTISDQSKFARAPRASLRPVFHFLNFFLNVPPTSFGGTLLAVSDWAHQDSPRASVGSGPKASVFAVRAGQVSSALPYGCAAPKWLRRLYPSPLQYPQSLSLR